jgi:hypothetical protein
VDRLGVTYFACHPTHRLCLYRFQDPCANPKSLLSGVIAFSLSPAGLRQSVEASSLQFRALQRAEDCQVNSSEEQSVRFVCR